MTVEFHLNAWRVQFSLYFTLARCRSRWHCEIGESRGHWAVCGNALGFGFRYQWRRIP